jgi:hypothetical protein
MPKVTMKTGIPGPDGRDEELSEFLCDAPGCPNVATQVLGFCRELRIFTAMCPEHAGPGGAAPEHRRESS